jgi:hypothetical protein
MLQDEDVTFFRNVGSPEFFYSPWKLRIAANLEENYDNHY